MNGCESMIHKLKFALTVLHVFEWDRINFTNINKRKELLREWEFLWMNFWKSEGDRSMMWFKSLITSFF